MALSNFDNLVVETEKKEGNDMSAAVATQYVVRLVQSEARGPGDTEGALRRLEAKYGLPYWPLVHLKRGAAKTVEVGLYARIRSAYLDMCERQVRKLQHEIAIEKAVEANDSLENLEAEALRLAARIEAAKVARKSK